MEISSYLLTKISTRWLNILQSLVDIGIIEKQVMSVMFTCDLVVVVSTSPARQETGETGDGAINFSHVT